MKVPIQQIRREFACFVLVGTVFLYSDMADPPRFLHLSPDSLVIHGQIAIMEHHCDAAIAIPSLVFVINCCDFPFCRTRTLSTRFIRFG